jgi:hypothetical protein
MSREQLLHGFAGGERLEHEFDRDPGSGDNRLADHDVGFNLNQSFGHGRLRNQYGLEAASPPAG